MRAAVDRSDRRRGAVVVTGASSGIGAACALRLARLGCQVWAGVRRPQDGERLVSELASVAALHGVDESISSRPAVERLMPMMLDIADAASIAAAAASVSADVGSAGLAGLVNSAGIAVAGPLEYLPLDALRRQLEVNVVGQLAVTQALLPLLRTGRGRIVNIGSVSGLVAAPFTGPYHASKFALEALTDALRVELRPWGLHVAIVEPGAVRTPIWARSLAAGDELLRQLPPEAFQRYGPAIAAVRSRALRTGTTARSPDRVVDAVVHALTAPRPRTRYLVGADARLGALVARLPDRLRDWLFARRLPPYGID